MNDPSSDGPPPVPKGSVGVGCFTGIVMQLVLCFFLFLPLSVAQWLPDIVLSLLMAAQWTILLPLIRRAGARGETNTRLGLIISAAIGALIGTACGGMNLLGGLT